MKKKLVELNLKHGYFDGDTIQHRIGWVYKAHFGFNLPLSQVNGQMIDIFGSATENKAIMIEPMFEDLEEKYKNKKHGSGVRRTKSRGGTS